MSTDVVEAVVRVHGGVKFYRGAAKAARAYVERDRSRADDYYLAEGTGVATRLTATPDGVEQAGSMDGETYEQWVAGIDVDTGRKKGRVRDDANALRFVEVTVNGPEDLVAGRGAAPGDLGRAGRGPGQGRRRDRRLGRRSTRPPGSGRAGGRCRCRSSRSRPR